MRRLKQAVQAGEVILGTWLNSPSQPQVEIIGYAGFDFVILDTEHSSYGAEAAEGLVRAGDAAGLPCLMRVSENTPAAVGKILDYGAQGVVIPHVSSAAEAEQAVRSAHLAPRGDRGAAPSVRATHYGLIPWSEYLQQAAAETLVVVQIEGREGLHNLDAIMAVDGVDVLFIGPFDLSTSLGISGQLDHPQLLAAVGDIVTRARARGIALGIWMPRPDQVGPWIQQGVQVVTVANNDMIFFDGCRRVAAAARERLPGRGAA